MSEKKKVLIIQQFMMKYRETLFNILAEEYDLTVCFTKDCSQVKGERNYKEVKLPVRKIGPFNIIKGLKKEIKKADIVICNTDFHMPQFLIQPFFKKNKKIIYWGIGFRASYTVLYDTNRKHNLLDKITGFVMNHADANVCYMSEAWKFWKNGEVAKEKLFVAPNTTPVEAIDETTKRDTILFVGSIRKEKGLDKLIASFAESAGKFRENGITLSIVGGGDKDLESELKKQVENLGVADFVTFHGPVFEEKELAKHFNRAIACVSPDQAGLTVPKSMGYGVVMITKRDAITGGELYHITPGETGILMESDGDLTKVLSDIASNKSRYLEMGTKARKYYVENATPRHQAQGFIDAINFATSKLSR